MFDNTQIVKVKWHSHNKQHYISRGYHFTRIVDEFEVPAYDLPPKSKTIIKYICDYCGQEKETTYAILNKSMERGKLACSDCKQSKRADSFVEKFGVASPGASAECRQLAKESMLERYGCEYALQCEQGQTNFKKSMKETYGYENPTYCPELQAKARASTFKNGNVPSSKPEREMVSMLKQLYGDENCIPGFPVDKVNLDCLLIVNGIKIDIEYDGIYWHKGREDYDRKRNHWLMSLGYKVIRILGNQKNTLPTIERLKEEVNYILSGHSIGYIDMNDEMNI